MSRIEPSIEETLAAYALGLLEPQEEEAALLLIARDPALRASVAELRRAAHLLALLAPPAEPPASHRARLLARVAAPPARRGGWWRAASGWAAGAGLALALALGGWNIALRGELERLESANAQLESTLFTERTTRQAMNEQLEAQDMTVRFLAGRATTSRELRATASAPGASGMMYMQPGQPMAVLVVDGLPPLPQDRTYQFWLARAGRPVPSATFNVDASGHAQMMIEAGAAVNGFEEVMVTVEPAAGSAQPSGGAVVLSGKL